MHLKKKVPIVYVFVDCTKRLEYFLDGIVRGGKIRAPKTKLFIVRCLVLTLSPSAFCCECLGIHAASLDVLVYVVGDGGFLWVRLRSYRLIFFIA